MVELFVEVCEPEQHASLSDRILCTASNSADFGAIAPELARIDQQIALIREQTLLATDEEQIGTALNALTSSFNEASRWLNDQRDLLGVLELNEQQSLPRYVLQEGGKPLAREAVKH